MWQRRARRSHRCWPTRPDNAGLSTRLACCLRISAAKSAAHGSTSTRSRAAGVVRRNNGTASVTNTRSTGARCNDSVAGLTNRPCAANAKTRRAPAFVSAVAARSIVPKVAIRSSRIRTVASRTSPVTISPPLTTPALRRLSTKAWPIGRCHAASSASRHSCTRFTPPTSGEATTTGASPTSFAAAAVKSSYGSRFTARRRNALSKAATLCASSVISPSQPAASNNCAMTRTDTGSKGLVRRSLRA